MKIQAVNPYMTAGKCEPVNKVDFTGRKAPKLKVEDLNLLICDDCFTPQETGNLEQKYDLACHLAAFYKNQYENLLKNGSCRV